MEQIFKSAFFAVYYDDIILRGGKLTKADIVDTIASAIGLTKVETEAVVDGFLSTVINAMREGKNIEIRGFGTFKVKKRKGKLARNPRTGEQVLVPDHFVPVFKVSKDVKRLVDDRLKRIPEEKTDEAETQL